MLLADLPFPTYKALDLAIRAQRDILTIGAVLNWSAIPLSLIPPLPKTWLGIFFRALFITVGIWFLGMFFRTEFEVPWTRIVLNIQEKDEMYDGVGGNVAWLLLGWVFPMFQCVVTLSIAKLLSKIKLRFRKK